MQDQETKTPALSRSAAWLKQARQMHLYLGTLFAPAIIFFALTGSIQLFGLHEGRPGDAYQPPSWVVKLGELHKKQTMEERHGPQPGFGGGQQKPPGFERPSEEHRESLSTTALRWFFLATSLGLVFTTVLGIYMAFKYNRSRKVVWSLLVAGTVIPGALIAMMALS
jgi:hypothetical protein